MSGAETSPAHALQILSGALEPITAIELVATTRARGRVLAHPVVAAVDLPPFDSAAMDGYALRSGDTGRAPLALQVVGQVLAGGAFPGTVGCGECVRIMTGAPMPRDSDAILVQEDAEMRGTQLWVHAPLAAGLHRRSRGEHVTAGATVLAAGRRLRSADIGLAASVGAATLAVFRRLRVGVLSTGDELTDAPFPLTGAQSYDANRPFLVAALERDGVEVVDLGIVGDVAEALAALLERASKLNLDAVVTSGGASLGDADIVRAAGGVQYIALATRPGRGLAWATLDFARPLLLLGLPGNAVAAFVVFNLLARPVLRHLAGEPARVPSSIPLALARQLRCKPGQIDYRRARLVHDAAGRTLAEPLPQQGSAMLRTICDADALLAIGPAASYRAGDLVPAVLLDTLE